MKLLKIALLSVLVLGYGCRAINGQPLKGDSVLYLFFDASKFKKNSNFVAIDPTTLRENQECIYRFSSGYNLYYGYPLEFISVHKENALKIMDIKKYNVVTPEELKSFIAKTFPEDLPGRPSFGYQGQSYFDNLKEIYMVEKSDDKKSYYFTKVRLDITME